MRELTFTVLVPDDMPTPEVGTSGDWSNDEFDLHGVQLVLDEDIDYPEQIWP